MSHLLFLHSPITCTTPPSRHWNAACYVVRYLLASADFGLIYVKGDIGLKGYGDADHAGCTDTRRSTGGSLFTVAGAAVCWSSRLQNVVALSTTEAEIMAASDTAREAAWLKKLFVDLHFTVGAVPIMCDNQTTIGHITGTTGARRTKYIDTHYHFAQDAHDNKLVTFAYIPTTDNVADIFTKALPTPAHSSHRAAMGVAVARTAPR